MANLLALVATNSAAWPWVWGTVASVLFVGIIAVPAAALNGRDRKRRQQHNAGAGAASVTD